MNNLGVDALFLSRGEINEYISRYQNPWEAIAHIKDIIAEIAENLDTGEYYSPKDGVYISHRARVAESAVIDAPAIIMEGAEIRHCAYVRGSVIIGKGAVVGNSSEVKNSILLDGAKLPHFNYAGDSILGTLAHLGAGAVISNLRLDGKSVSILYRGERIDTGMRKLGALIGDGAEIGCGAVLNPGTVVAPRSRIYPLSSVKGYIEAPAQPE